MREAAEGVSRLLVFVVVECGTAQRGVSARGGAVPGRFPQPFHVTHRRLAEETFVFAVEVRGVVVTDALSRAGRVEAPVEHAAASLLKAQPFLELQGDLAVTALKW
jgi:hypothetical protein